MKEKLKGNVLVRNLSFAMIAQVISLLSSFFVQFFAPKVLSVTEFAYWQLFLLYVTYINITRLGIIDGMYLKNGGKRREELNLSVIKSQWILFAVMQLLFSTVLAFISLKVINDSSRLFVVVACAVCLFIINMNNYFGHLFQSINKTNIFSISEVIYNLMWFVAVAVILLFRIGSFRIIVFMYIIGQVLAGIYLIFKAKSILFSKCAPIKETFAEMFENIKAGLPLLVAFYASILITSIVRMVVDDKWGIEVFGYFSFALSLTTFVLKFISQAGMVIFPAIRMVDSAKQINIYKTANVVTSLVLPLFLISFIPIKHLVNWWLPQYEQSLCYLGILLPILIFDGKMQLLYSTYFKVIRKEKFLLFVNLLALFISFAFASFSAYVFNSIEGAAWAMLLAISVRSLISEMMLNKWLGISCINVLQVTEVIIIIGFSVLSNRLTNSMMLILFIFAYIIYLFVNKSELKNFIQKTILK